MLSVVLVFFVTFLASSLAATNNDTIYCEKDLCPSGYQPHIACGNTGEFSSSCPQDRRLINLTNENIKKILDEHNNYRNIVASGKQTGFKSAAKMKTLIWNDELAYLAKLNVMQCKMAHDVCRSTTKYKYAGQNLGIIGNSANFDAVDDAITTIVKNWFNEVKDATQSLIDNCCSSNGKTTGHFTQLVTDEATQIGCAITQYTENGFKFNLIACNYSRTNIEGTKVYQTGEAASACIKGKNPNFTALCIDTESS